MRYKTDEIPPELLAVNASDDMLMLTAVIGALIGIVLFYLGRKGRQLWMWTWGLGLVAISAYLGIDLL